MKNTLKTEKTVALGEIKLQHDLICEVEKVKAATSAHSMVGVILFLAYLLFPSNPTLKFPVISYNSLLLNLPVQVNVVNNMSVFDANLNILSYYVWTGPPQFHFQ